MKYLVQINFTVAIPFTGCGLPAIPAPWSRLGGSRSASWLSCGVCLLVLSQANHITHGGHYSPSAADKARPSSRHCAPLRIAYEQHICDSFRGYVSLPNSGRGNMSPRLYQHDEDAFWWPVSILMLLVAGHCRWINFPPSKAFLFRQ
jgi:hypothetical protein